MLADRAVIDRDPGRVEAAAGGVFDQWGAVLEHPQDLADVARLVAVDDLDVEVDVLRQELVREAAVLDDAGHCGICGRDDRGAGVGAVRGEVRVGEHRWCVRRVAGALVGQVPRTVAPRVEVADRPRDFADEEDVARRSVEALEELRGVVHVAPSVRAVEHHRARGDVAILV